MSSEKEVIASLVKLYMQEESLSEEIKDVKSEAKDSGYDSSLLAAVAKSIVKNKLDELKDKSEALVRLIEVSRS
jgi:uncharacterized protein (UPF0335 family)